MMIGFSFIISLVLILSLSLSLSGHRHVVLYLANFQILTRLCTFILMNRGFVLIHYGICLSHSRNVEYPFQSNLLEIFLRISWTRHGMKSSGWEVVQNLLLQNISSQNQAEIAFLESVFLDGFHFHEVEYS